MHETISLSYSVALHPTVGRYSEVLSLNLQFPVLAWLFLLQCNRDKHGLRYCSGTGDSYIHATHADNVNEMAFKQALPSD